MTLSGGASADAFFDGLSNHSYIHLVAYTDDGDLRWAKRIEPSNSMGDVEVFGLAADDDDNLYLFGGRSGGAGGLTFGQGEPGRRTILFPSTIISTTRPFVARFSPDGTFEWVRLLTNAAVDDMDAERPSLAAAGLVQHGVVVAGGFAKATEFGPGSPREKLIFPAGQTSTDAFVMHLTPTGAFGWIRSIGGTDDGDRTQALVLDDDGRAVVAGMVEGDDAVFGRGEPGEETPGIELPGFINVLGN